MMRLPLLFACLLTVVFTSPAPGIIVAGTDPNAALYSGAAYTGVVRVNLGGTGLCTGSLFGPSNIYVLTAAHCVTDASGAKRTDLTNYTVAFDTPSQAGQLDPISAIYVAPGYAGAGAQNNFANDLAVVKLQNLAPADANSYSLFTTNVGDIGREVRLVGEGASGTGNTGTTISPSTDPANRRTGLNDYNLYANGDLTHVLYDFDNGQVANNAIVGSSLGRGLSEVTIAPGDSGGPSFDFATGLIVGVHSYNTCYVSIQNMNVCASPPDVMANLAGPGGFFGELGADTRVSLYGDFLSQFTTTVPEPGTWALAGSAGFLLLVFARRRRA